MYVYLLHVIPNFRLLPIHNTTFQTTPNTQYHISDYSRYAIPNFRHEQFPTRPTKFQTTPNTSYQISDDFKYVITTFGQGFASPVWLLRFAPPSHNPFSCAFKLLVHIYHRTINVLRGHTCTWPDSHLRTNSAEWLKLQRFRRS